MAISRYIAAPILGLGSQRGTSTACAALREAVKSGAISYKESYNPDNLHLL